MIFLLPVLTGLLFAASFPCAGQGYLAWIALCPLVVFLIRAKGVRAALAGGIAAAFPAYFILLIWMPPVLAHYGGMPALLAWTAYSLLIAVLSCYPAACCALTRYVMNRLGEPFILLFPVFWVLFEYAVSVSPFGGFPWLLAGYSQSNWLSVIQMADLTGVYGVSFLVVSAGTAIAWLVHNRGRSAAACMPAAAVLVLVAGCLAYGRMELRRWDRLHPAFSAAMLQANISFDDPETVMLDKFQNGYVRMANRLKTPVPHLLILPESPSPLFYEMNPAYQAVIKGLAGRFPMGLVFNNVRSKETQGNQQYFNSAYFLDQEGSEVGIYDKIHLVPFGEYIPLRDLFFFVDTITKDVSDFDAGQDYRIVKVGNKPASAIICFEAAFPALVRKFIQNGSRLIINLTNDGWYGDSAAPYQHLAIARFRAVENRRYFLRSTNSGISAFIQPTGRMQSSTGILQEAVCVGKFDFVEALTFYTRYGDAFILLCAIISCGAVALSGLQSIGIVGIHKRRF